MNKKLFGIVCIVVGVLLIVIGANTNSEEPVNSEYTDSMIEAGYDYIDMQSDNMYENIDAAIDYIMNKNEYDTFEITYVNSANSYGTTMVDLLFDGTDEWLVEITKTKIFINKKQYEE